MTSASVLAEQAVATAPSEPTRAEELARAAIAAAKVGDHAAVSMAERALGLAARERHDLEAAVAHLEEAASAAERHGLAAHAALARLSLAGALAYGGDGIAALREVELAAGHLRGRELAQALFQRASVLHHLGRPSEALDGYRSALPLLRRAGDELNQARLHNNRGLLRSQLGDLAGARADLERAEALHHRLGNAKAVADVRNNLGVVAVLQGNLPVALRWFQRADEDLSELAVFDPMAVKDRCTALLAARLVAEARATAERAVAALSELGMAGDAADARLLLSEAALLDGDVEVARDQAGQALAAFTRQRRPAHAALARAAGLRAEWAAGERSERLLLAARHTTQVLERAGWTAAALDAHVIAARLALGLGRPRAARRHLARAAAARERGPVGLRSRAWHAEALLRLADGDAKGADSALRAGLRALERHRASLVATELRAHASGHAIELAGTGLQLAVEGGRPERILAWAERCRSSALHQPSRPPEDPELAGLLAELRQVVGELEQATLVGRDVTRLRGRQARLEDEVRRRARLAPASGDVARRRPPLPTPRDLAAVLGERALIEIVDAGGALGAVVVVGGRARFRLLGSSAAAIAELDALRFSLRRLALGRASEASLAAAADGVAYAAARLDAQLLAPLAAEIGDRPLVVVPTGALHALPWAALPSCLGRPVSVAPSAALWLRGARAGRPAGGRSLLVAGPGLPHADSEVTALARRLPSALCLTGTAATVGAVASAMDGAALAHVAAHGHFRSDNALLSSLALVDGPLTVYDIEALHRAPATLVLSSCEGGLSSVCPGDELMGMASALFGLGATTLVAAVAPVPDGVAEALMLAFHAGMGAGLGPAESLARAQAASSTAPATAFVCFGSS